VKEKTYAVVREFVDKFTALHGSIECKELLGCDLSTSEGYSYAIEQNLFRTICPELVQHAAEIIEEFL
jgi:hypothetical protein